MTISLFNYDIGDKSYKPYNIFVYTVSYTYVVAIYSQARTTRIVQSRKFY